MPILNKKLALVAPFASTDKLRPALQCVRFTRNGQAVTTVATDSYALVRITCHDLPLAADFSIVPNSPSATDLAGELLVPATVVSATAKDIPKKSSLSVLLTAALIRTQDSTAAELVATDLEKVSRHGFRVCDEKYPDTDSLFTVPVKDAVKIRVNAEYLGKIADLFHAFNDNGKGNLNAIDIEISSDLSTPIRFIAEHDGHKAEALLMKISQ